MTKSKVSISVVIPAFEEELRIPDTICRIHEYLTKRSEEFEIIVVDDGSSDNTARLVENLGNALLNIKLKRNAVNKGKGFSVREGILSSLYPFILVSDADLSTPIEELERLLPYCYDGFDIVIGSRGLKESDIVKRQPWYRERMGKIFNLIVRTVALDNFKDTQCGFKVFKADAAQKIFNLCRIDGFSFDVEMLFVAQKMGYRIKEVPIRWIDSPSSRIRILRDSFRMLVDIFVIKLNWMRRVYHL
jgi:dolichyl-phosphate beta-glucosyltransferase